MNCPACNSTIPDENKFCPNCGRSLSQEDEPTALDPMKLTTPEHGRFQPGQKIGDRYRIVSLLGRGGMGEVYRADDLRLGQSVALKFLPERLAADPKGLDGFKREVRTARGVTHLNVCRIHDIGEADGLAFLSMEYVDGEDLSQVLTRLGRPTKEKAMEITRQLCLAIAAAHEAGVIHRDLKPSNIMIDGRGQVRVMDFGIAGLQKELAGEPGITGTPTYMAPELFKGISASVQTDVYALGLVLYEIFTGKKAFQAENISQLKELHETSAPATPSSLVADMDPLVETAVIRCLEKDPKLRPASVYALLASLPGGDPLAAAMAAGQTPSPKMVAAAGDEGTLGRNAAIACISAVAIGLVLICWLAKSTYLVNNANLQKHPEALANEARRMIEMWGYHEKPIDQAFGFLREGEDRIRFWYRQRRDELLQSQYFYRDWNEYSYARATHRDPPWSRPGESGVRLTPDGKLIRFRMIPSRRTEMPEISESPNWSELFPEDILGFDLDTFNSVAIKELPPPDAFDHVKVWKGHSSESTNEFYVEAASYRGKPVYFEIINPSRFEDVFPTVPPVSLAQQSILFIYFALAAGASVLGWRNFQAGRSDGRGAFRIAFFLFSIGMVAWLFLASHRPSALSEIIAFQCGLAQSLLAAGTFWLFYIALEPFVRRFWPQALISWTRLAEGRWRDPLIGRDLLVGVLFAVTIVVIVEIEVLAPSWLDLTPRSMITSNVLTIEGLVALIGFFFASLVKVLWETLFALLFLLFLRLILRRTVLVWVAFLVIFTPIFVFMMAHHPILGWIVVTIQWVLYLWVITRFGFLATLASAFTGVLLSSPITTDLSAWYAGYGLIGVSLVAAMASYGFYTSQGGRPIFRDPLVEP